MTLRSWRPPLLFLTASVILVTVFFRLQTDLSAWRLAEIGELLSSQQARAMSESFMLLVGKMELLRRKAERLAEVESDDRLEVRLRLMTPETFPSGESGPSFLPLRWERELVTGFVSALRVLQGKDPAEAPAVESEDLRDAYAWERGRRYLQAIPLYSKALTQPGLERSRESAILLHLGFCQVLGGARVEGRASFVAVRDGFPGTDAAAAAISLLKSLDYFEARLASVPSDSDKATLGRLAFYLADYATAERYLREAVQSSSDPESTYLLGRVAEETGRSLEAEALYRSAASSTTEGVPTAALRRLYLLGTFYEKNAELAEEARSALIAGGAADWVQRLPQADPPVPVSIADPAPATLALPVPVAPVPVAREEKLVFETPAEVPARWAPSLAVPRTGETDLLRPSAPLLAPPDLAAQLAPVPRKAEFSPVTWTLLTAGTLGALSLGGSLTAGALQYQQYQASTNSQEAARLHDQLLVIQTVNLISAIAAGTGLLGGGLLGWFETAEPPVKKDADGAILSE